jgi:hypothetical protein
MTTREGKAMTDSEDRLNEILERLTAIAEALTDQTPPPRTPPTPQQSATIVDYLVLREVVGRRADELSRVVSAERRVRGRIDFPDAPPIEDGVRVAVFTERGNPAEVVTVDGSSGPRSSPRRTVTLTQVDDTQPIIRIEIRRDDDIAVALGPRLAAVA